MTRIREIQQDEIEREIQQEERERKNRKKVLSNRNKIKKRRPKHTQPSDSILGVVRHKDPSCAEPLLLITRLTIFFLFPAKLQVK